MDSQADTMQVAIYHIDTSLFPDLTNDEIVDHLVEEYNRNLPPDTTPFELQPLKDGIDLNQFNVKVFYSKKTRCPQWKGFLKPILDDGADLLKGSNRDISFVAFIYDDDGMFAVTGGQGNFLIQKYINSNFGIDIITRLISESSKAIRSLEERGLTGSLLASSKYYRFDYRLIDEDSFGKFYKTVKAGLDVTLAAKLGISEDSKKNIGCVARSSFKVNKAIDLNLTLELIRNIVSLLEKTPNFTLNKAVLVSKRQQKWLIDRLNHALAETVLEAYRCEHCSVDLDVCDPQYEKFLCADSYNAYVGYSSKPVFEHPVTDVPGFTFIRHVIDKTNPSVATAEDMLDLLRRVRLKSFNSENQVLTDGPLLRHLNGEISYDGKIYFLLDGEWYEIQEEFLGGLNEQFKQVFNERHDLSILTEEWDLAEDEKRYNQRYLYRPGYLVLHRVLVDNIEVSDIVKFDERRVYLIHVKKGFDNAMRDLTLQALISAGALFRARMSNDESFFERLYQSLKEKKESEDPDLKTVGSQADIISEEDFVNILKTRDMVVCLAFVDMAREERDVKEISSFRSNIAKHSLIELYRTLRAQGIPMELIQVKRAGSSASVR